MFTCDFNERKGVTLTDFLVQKIRESIISGELKPDEKLPSKRALASHLGISVITVANAYGELIAEGYLYSFEKRGFFVTNLERFALRKPKSRKKAEETSIIENIEKTKNIEPRKLTANFRTNTTSYEKFPFSLWAKVMRSVLNAPHESMLLVPPSQGVVDLRKEIALYLDRWRNMKVSYEQIIIGAGSEHLYAVLVALLGRDRVFAVENPGYPKISAILSSNGASISAIPVDESGIDVEELKKSNASVVHVSPSHHFPTGQVMPIKRRHELLRWSMLQDNDRQTENAVNENITHQPDFTQFSVQPPQNTLQNKLRRYIIEDDYDSEFRFTGKPLATLQSQDTTGAVIYINTFSKTLSPSFRISYMVLPFELIHLYRRMFSAYACPVSSFEQYALSKFMHDGYFESHLLRMKNYYRSLRNELIKVLEEADFGCPFYIKQEGEGLHFLVFVELKTSKAMLQKHFEENGLDIPLIEDFLFEKTDDFEIKNAFTLVFNYSGLKKESIKPAVNAMKKALQACIKQGAESTTPAS